jgi:hypothetical protein
MHWEDFELAAARRSRVWLASPAIATAIFFVAQFFLAAITDRPHSSVRGASAETPKVPVKVRVVSEIRSFDSKALELKQVPSSETELLELFKKQGHGAVVFLPIEVDTVSTVEKKFATEEVGVIKVDSKPLSLGTTRTR